MTGRIVVSLDGRAWRLGRNVGKERDHTSNVRGWTHNGGAQAGRSREAQRWFHVLGALGECAVAKAADIFWAGMDYDRHAPDVARWEVRTTHHPHGCLLLRDADRSKADRPFILVTALDWRLGRWGRRTFALNGWAWGRDVMQPHYRRTDCWMMPQANLQDMETLPLPARGGWSKVEL